MDLITSPRGPLSSNTYIVKLDDFSLVIDPSVPPRLIEQSYPAVKYIFATHAHIDHVVAADIWRRETKAQLLIHSLDAPALAKPSGNLSYLLGDSRRLEAAERVLADAEVIRLDQRHTIEVIHTPGHSAGSVCLLLTREGKAQYLFSGDTLFLGSVGRTDFTDGDEKALNDSLKKLEQLVVRLGLDAENDLVVLPGHGSRTTLLREIKNNPYWPRSG